jgi:aquaporin Z
VPGPRRPDPGVHWRIWGAEAAATALLVAAIVLVAGLTLGRGSAVADALPGRGARFLALGVIVAPVVALISVSPLGRLSGAHTNPAVTLGFWLLGRVSAQDLVGYIVAQFVGGVAGAALARAVLPGGIAMSIGGAVTHPTVAPLEAVALEVGMTGALLVLIFAFVADERLARRTPLAIMPLLATLIWLGSPLTGASLNPARSAGPALVFGDLGDLWVYLLAPPAAALLVAPLWRLGPVEPKTAKVFHDPRYPCSLGSELPAMPV